MILNFMFHATYCVSFSLFDSKQMMLCFFFNMIQTRICSIQMVLIVDIDICTFLRTSQLYFDTFLLYKQQVLILCGIYKYIRNFHVSSCRTHNSAKTAAISRIDLMLLYVDTCFMCVMVNVMNKKCLHLSYLSSSASLSSHFSILHCNQFSSNFWLLPQFKSQITSGKR